MNRTEMPKLTAADVKEIKMFVKLLKPRLHYQHSGHPRLHIWDESTYHNDYMDREPTEERLARHSMKIKHLFSRKQQQQVVEFLHERFGIEALSYSVAAPEFYKIPERLRLCVRFIYKRI